MNKREWMLQAALTVLGTKTDIEASHVEHLALAYDAIVAASGDDGWIEHRGEKPYPEGLVEVKARSGSKGVVNADDLIWTHDGKPWDIIAWRPAT